MAGIEMNPANEQTATGLVVPLEELHPFPNQPFKVRNDDAMNSLVESIRQNGLLNRIIIRPRDAGGYEIIAGHRRVEACRILGYDAIAADVRTDLGDNDAAVLAMIETNLRQRPKLLPSERSWAYRMMRDALQHRGERNDLQNIQRKRTREEVSEMFGENPRQISRYIRLTYLDGRLKDYTDSGALKVGSAVAISFLDAEVQRWIVDHYEQKHRFPNQTQIGRLRRLCEESGCTRAAFDAVMQEEPNRAESLDFVTELRREFFPNLMDEDVKIKLRELVEEYFHRKNMMGY